MVILLPTLTFLLNIYRNILKLTLNSIRKFKLWFCFELEI